MITMGGMQVIDRPAKVTGDETGLEGASQVVLFNDDHNEAGFVVECLMRVFGHNAHLAIRIMMEAHRRGRAIAEVEEGDKAQLHKDQLQSYGLTAAVEKVL